MGFLRRLGFVLLVLISGRLAVCAENSASELPVVMANDNRIAAGQLKDGVLELELDLRQGRWYPEDETGQYRDVYAFAEQRRGPQSSGPLIRVPQGTQIRASIHNALPVAAKIFGLHRHPGDAKDALTLAPDETRQVQFVAGEAGTYLYWATTTDKSGKFGKDPENLLSGAFVIDAPGNKMDDRIFVIGIWSKGTTPADFEEIESINGRSWPYTERLTLKLGETVHWRVINASASAHAMHLHGFFFTAAATSARKLQLVISDNPGKIPLYKLEVNDPLKPAEGDEKKTVSLLGPPIVLTRGEAAEIEVKNQSSNPTVIHWHGIELENYFDGVDGWTGAGGQTTPPIPPGTSFVARMTPPRAGTFIYHTHWHDSVQLRNGVYGPLIVLEPGQKYDPEHDQTFVFSIGKYEPFGFLLLVNGSPQPSPVELHTATRYRLRLINITSNSVDLRVRLNNQGAPAKWKVVAKDGADLPAAQLKSCDAEMGIAVGETYDVEYQSDGAGQADMVVWDPIFYPPVTMRLQFLDVKAEVR